MHTYTILLEKRKAKRLLFDIAIICIGLFWMIKGEYGIAMTLIIVALFGFYTNRKLVVFFSKDKISYPSFITKTYSWDEVSNVILKDDVLTIDLKNNKLLQSTISAESAAVINEDEFNAFCMERLSN